MSVALSCPALQKRLPAGHTLLLSWKANSLPFLHLECSSKEAVFLLLSAILNGIILQATRVVNKLKIILKKLTLFSRVVVTYGLEGDVRELCKDRNIPCPLSLNINKHCRGWELM